MTFTRRLSFAIVAMSARLMFAGMAVGAEPASSVLPEYRFEVGQELTYFGTNEMTYDAGTMQTLSRWQFFVIGQKSEGTWELLVRSARLFKQVPKDQDLDQAKSKMKEALDAPDSDSVVKTFGRFTIDRHGIIHGLPAMAELYAKVSHLFVGLPRSQEETQHGWTVTDTSVDETFLSQQLQSSIATQFVIKSLVQSSQNAVFEIEENLTTTFDREAGIPKTIMTKTVQNYAPKGASTMTAELVSVKKHSPEWIAACTEEATSCFAVIEEHEKTVENRDLDPAQFEERLQQSREKLERMATTLKTDELKSAMLDQTAEWKQHQDYQVRTANERAAMIGTASADWKTTDLAGNDASLSSFEGKVVVMDFWYRGCGWCIVAMPQVKAVAEHFQGQPVAVLGMNTDSRLANAMFAIEKLDLKYPTLKAEKIADEYKIGGFPALLILDQKGVIRDVHVGYSQNLKSDVIRSVEKLLSTVQ